MSHFHAHLGERGALLSPGHPPSGAHARVPTSHPLWLPPYMNEQHDWHEVMTRLACLA